MAIHTFLLIVAKPAARVPVDPLASLNEIIRVTKYEAAIMAIREERLIGTMGVIQVAWWYNPAFNFMVDRWNFVLPQFRNGPTERMMIAEADSIAAAGGMEFINQGKIRGKGGHLMLMPRSTRLESAIPVDQQRA